jgi:hypothetical protein
MVRLIVLGTLVAGALASPLSILPKLLELDYFTCLKDDYALCSNKPDTTDKSARLSGQDISNVQQEADESCLLHRLHQ